MKKNILLITVLFCVQLFSQNNQSTLKIFVNCENCDVTYIKQNLDYVDFVRDQKFADVQLLFRNQRNGSGGNSYEIEFIGQNNYKNNNDKLSFSTKTDTTENEVREMMLKYIKLGLVKYWVKNGIGNKLNIQMEKPKSIEVKKTKKDPWNKWVFELGIRGYFYGQETSKDRNLNFSVSAKQVTKENKFYFRGSINDSKSVFTFDGTDIISNQKSSNIYLYDVISINNHWSVGGFSNAGKSTYSNKSFYAELKPAIEYNFFSYEESSKKQLTLSYKVGGVYNKYFETTIFDKKNEFLWEHGLMLGGSVVQKWGNFTSQVSYESFLHDTSLHAFSFYIGANFRIFKGFSFNVNGNYSITNNQINLAAGDLSLEELLLRQQQVKSGYNYFFNIGLSYSFGSMFNTIVNPRFNF
jgi:hypothetical protein